MTLTILCEGKRDCTFLEKIVNDSLRVVNYHEKDKILREIIDRSLMAKVNVIIENGKQKLIKNINLIVSKLRSIRQTASILAIIDLDTNKVEASESLTGKIEKNIKSLINDPRRFHVLKPSLSSKRESSCYHVINVTYHRGVKVNLHVITIPIDLEHWVKNARDLQDLSKHSWFKTLVNLLEKHGVRTRTLTLKT
ncbi:MAG TPA: hypothetical protein ENF87_02000 [Thermoproteales archaeon]|nr:hypothetical protein [Thermoproteales archaeon]